MVAPAATAPGTLPTDACGGVLIFPRNGNVSVSFAPSLAEYTGDLLVIGVWADDNDDANYVLPESIGKALGLQEILNHIAADAEFKAKSGSSTDIVHTIGSGAKRVILYGLGKKSKGGASVAGAAKFAVQKGTNVKNCKSVGLYIDNAGAADIAQAAEGGIVGGYVDERYRESKESEKVPTELVIVGVSQNKEMDDAVKRGTAIATGIITTKEVVAAPANTLTPATLGTAAEMVGEEENLTVKVMGREECEKLGMGCYLGVGRGSSDEPKFIHITYKPSGDVKKKLCLVGKAVTFDSGGYNLKTSGGIEMMKFDMGGSGVCLGTAKTVGQLKPKGVEVHFIMPAVENMIGNLAIHPGDILKASNGKTVEILNTDAEGRLALADALVYAENLGDVDYVVDLATLTGAIITSLGNDVAGMWSPSDELAETLLECSKATGEGLWRMPLVDEYAEQMKSKIADLRNIGAGRAGSSIQAALFLREFVKTKNWAHLDIAGTVWSEKKGGATGYGVRTMVNWIETFVEKE